jgi:hypothetical protein
MTKVFDSDTARNAALTPVIEELAAAMSRNSCVTEAEFKDIFNSTVSTLGLEDAEVMNLVGISQLTLDRWKAGKSAPAPLMRPLVFRTLKTEVSRNLAIPIP